MRETVVIEKNLCVSADKAWAAIRAIGGLDRWFPIISACKVEGEGVGALRVLTLAGGGEMRDRIVEISSAERRLRYARTHLPFPVSEYQGVVEIRGDGASCVLIWTVQFSVEPAMRDEMAGLVKSAISDGVDGLERELRG
jgi:hypothetical protein